LHEALNLPVRPTDNLIIQPKLMIDAVGDKYEEEADRIAVQVVDAHQSSQQGELVRHQEINGEEGNELQLKPLNSQIQQVEIEKNPQMMSVLQRPSNGIAAPVNLESAITQARGNGQPLINTTRRSMEQIFGVDFSNVRIHADTQSDYLNQTLQAQAFTTGQDIFFKQSVYKPESSLGRALIAHELTHVVQQHQGKVRATTQVAGVPVNDDPSLEQAGDRMGQLSIQSTHSLQNSPLQHLPFRTELHNANLIQMTRGSRAPIKSKNQLSFESTRAKREQAKQQEGKVHREEESDIKRQEGTFEEGQSEINKLVAE
jgi:hypothetical protein